MSISVAGLPVAISDEVNARILAVSEDRLAGFQADPFGAIAEQAGLDVEVVIARIRAIARRTPPFR